MAVALIATILVTWAGRATADDERMLLDVSINARRIDLIGDFVLRDGKLIATAKEWRSLGLIIPNKLAPTDTTQIALSSLRGVTGKFDMRAQTLSLTAEPSALIPEVLNLRPELTETTVDTGGFGAVVNYSLYATDTNNFTVGNGLVDARLYGPDGVFDSSQTVSTEPGTDPIVRLSTNYTYSDPSHVRQLTAGDVLSSGLAWTRSFRLAGLQIASNFDLQPDLVTFPVPTVRGSVAVPSTVDLLVNGIKEFSQPVPPGPFELRSIPVVTGASNVTLVVNNILGQQSVQSLPFYTASNLLAAGFTSYGGELGAVRSNYGLYSDEYGIPAADGSIRHGITDWLTAEAHAEATSDLGLGGLGFSARLGNFGVLSAAAADSKSHRNGFLYSLGFQRQSGRISVNLSTTRTSSHYSDIVDRAGDVGQRSVSQAGLGFSFGSLGFLGFSYDAISYRGSMTEQPSSGIAGNPGLYSDIAIAPSDSRVVSATYSVEVHHSISLYATGFSDLGESGGYGMTMGLSVPLGGRTTAGGYVQTQGRVASYGLQSSRSATDIGDLGWNVNLGEGEYAQRQAELDYVSSKGEVSTAFDQAGNTSSGRIGLTGAIVAAGGGVFATNTIDDAFAVVKTAGLPNIPVWRENRLVGNTDSNGRLLVTDLRSYQDNRIAIDPLSLPIDAQIGQLTRVVRPADRSGVVVDFAIKRGNAARFRIVDATGAALPLGTMISVEGTTSAAPIGFDGTTYLTDLPPTGTLDAASPDGGFCTAKFSVSGSLGRIPLIGPLSCR